MSMFQDLQDRLTEDGIEFELKDSYFSGDKNKAIVRKFNNIEIMVDFADMTGSFFEIWTNDRGEQLIYTNSADDRIETAYKELSDPVKYVLDCIAGCKRVLKSKKATLRNLQRKEERGGHVDYMDMNSAERRVNLIEGDLENYEHVLNELGR